MIGPDHGMDGACKVVCGGAVSQRLAQLSQRLVLENRSLDDLHYFVLVENARAQLRLDEALNLRGAQYCLGRAGLQLTRPHICQITARDDASVGGTCAG